MRGAIMVGMVASMLLWPVFLSSCIVLQRGERRSASQAVIQGGDDAERVNVQHGSVRWAVVCSCWS